MSNEASGNPSYKLSDAIKEYLGHGALFALIVIGLVFGYFDKEVQMGLTLATGAVCFALLNLDKFEFFKSAGFEAKIRQDIDNVKNDTAELRKDVEPVIAKETEFRLTGNQNVDEALLTNFEESNYTNAVLSVLGESEYTWRHAEGISEDLHLPRDDVEQALQNLKHVNLVEGRDTNFGARLWNLTVGGRMLYKNFTKEVHRAAGREIDGT